MISKAGRWTFLLIILAGVFVMAILSCAPQDSYEGTYSARGEGLPRQGDITIELNEKGQGILRVGDNEVSFRWSVQGDEIRLSTKAGGVIVGTIQDDGFNVTLPGMKQMSFTETQITP
ncbi:hypothetical protein ACFLU6_12025 [Acidobacteriota bacterium]